MPAYSPRTYLFRGNLAAASFFDNTSCIRKQSDGPLDLRRLTQKLRRLGVSNKSETDYVELSAKIAILDMAVDICLPSPDTLDKAQEESFNGKVDELAYEVKALFSNIPDAGAGHITRTEAKEVINRVHYRIAYGVRTKPKPKRNLFDSAMSAKNDPLPASPLEGPLAKFLKKKS